MTVSDSIIFVNYITITAIIQILVYSFFTLSLLQKARFAGDFSRREAKAEGAGGHFWHDEALTQTS